MDELKDECETLKAVNKKLKEDLERMRADHVRAKDELAATMASVKSAAAAASAVAPSPVVPQALSVSPILRIASPPGKGPTHTHVPDLVDELHSSVFDESASSFERARLEREVEALRMELVRAAKEAKAYESLQKGMGELERMLADLGRRHAVALEMLGEKESELKIMEEEMAEVKRSFRQQLLDITQGEETPQKK